MKVGVKKGQNWTEEGKGEMRGNKEKGERGRYRRRKGE